MSSTTEEKELEAQLFVVRLKELLDDGESEEATKHFASGEECGNVERSLWDLVPLLAARLNKVRRFSEPEVFGTCEKLLCKIAKKCNPRETLLLLLEELKNTEDEVTFACLSKLLRESVMRAGPSRVIDWCVRSIKNYIDRLPQPENEKPRACEASEETEETAGDEDPIVERLLLDYSSILDFLEPVVDYAALGETQDTKTRNYLLGIHIFLFGRPFCHLNDKSPKTKVLLAASLTQVSKLTGNYFAFLRVIEERSLGRRKRLTETSEDDPDEHSEAHDLHPSKASDLAYGNFYYTVLNSEEGTRNTPLVYNPLFLTRDLFYLSDRLLRQPEYVLVSKGLKIVEALLRKIETHSMGREYLEQPIYRDLFAALTQVMIYCDSDVDRKSALGVFRAYVDRFDIRARYLVVLGLYETSNHSGLIGLLTAITKSSVIQCLEQVPRCEYFLGRNLERLLKRICRLANGSATDLVEVSDETIAALNLLRFLTIRDRDDSTGIWSVIDGLEKNYLKPLREGIDLSRAHWKIKVRDLEEHVKTGGKEEPEVTGGSVSVSVGGQDLTMMPASEKIKFCHQALNALDIMESIVIRVNECIEENRSRVDDRPGKINEDN